jgi:hypothetical protein
MLNILKIENGFEMNSESYIFDGDAVKINATQAHIPTNKGIIFLDTSVTINEQSFENIQDLIDYLIS